jgi:hypothetical protein
MITGRKVIPSGRALEIAGMLESFLRGAGRKSPSCVFRQPEQRIHERHSLDKVMSATSTKAACPPRSNSMRALLSSAVATKFSSYRCQSGVTVMV